MKKILILVYLLLLIAAGNAQTHTRINYTGTDNGTLSNCTYTYNVTFSNSNVINVTFTIPYPTDNQPVFHNSQTCTSNFTSTPSYTTSYANPDIYNNNYQTVSIDNPGTTSVNATLTISGSTIVNIPAFIPTDAYPLTNIPADISVYTNATTNIQSTNFSIKFAAQSLVGSNTKLYKVVEELAKYVMGRTDYDLSVAQDAYSVYTNMKGSCAGFTNLMVALLRSIGIPARSVSGILLGTSSTSSGYHAVYEVYYPSLGAWVQGDPQAYVHFCESNFVIYGHYADMDEKKPTISYGYSGTKPTFTASISPTFSHNQNFQEIDRSTFPCYRTTCNLALLSTSDLETGVGIHDIVQIKNPPTGSPFPPNTFILSLGSTASFYAKFTSYEGNTYPTNWNWTMDLYHDGGSYTIASANFNGTTSDFHWTPTVSTVLPNYNWILDENGNIIGKVTVTVHINDGDFKSDNIGISVINNAISCAKNIENTVYTSNATITGCNIKLKNVTIQNNANVVFDSETETTITGTFDVALGSALEVK